MKDKDTYKYVLYNCPFCDTSIKNKYEEWVDLWTLFSWRENTVLLPKKCVHFVIWGFHYIIFQTITKNGVIEIGHSKTNPVKRKVINNMWSDLFSMYNRRVSTASWHNGGLLIHNKLLTLTLKEDLMASSFSVFSLSVHTIWGSGWYEPA